MPYYICVKGLSGMRPTCFVIKLYTIADQDYYIKLSEDIFQKMFSSFPVAEILYWTV